MFRVLLPIDSDEERALTQARFVASLPHAPTDVEATLVHVFPDEETAEKTSVAQTIAGRRAHDYLAEQSITVRSQSRFGDPAVEILHAADDIDADLVVLGGRKRSPLGSFLFGSVSQAVTLDATRPVALTGGIETPLDEATATATEVIEEAELHGERGDTAV